MTEGKLRSVEVSRFDPDDLPTRPHPEQYETLPDIGVEHSVQRLAGLSP